MKQVVHFTGTKAQKEAQGLRAAKNYLGKTKYANLMRYLSTLPARPRIKACRLMFVIAGIDSYWSLRGVVKEAHRISIN